VTNARVPCTDNFLRAASAFSREANKP
jgi:hypothetical protein